MFTVIADLATARLSPCQQRQQRQQNFKTISPQCHAVSANREI